MDVEDIMSIDHALRDVQVCNPTPPIPRCYARKPKSKAIDQVRIDAYNNATLMVLSVITGVAAFVVVYGGCGL